MRTNFARYVPMALLVLATILGSRVSAYADYQEECQREGCSNEEKKELWESYNEECLHKSCSREELYELGGSPQGASEMLVEFKRLGWRINEGDFKNLICNFTERKEANYAFYFCQDVWECPDGRYESSWYLCGFIWKWTFRF